LPLTAIVTSLRFRSGDRRLAARSPPCDRHHRIWRCRL